MNDHYTDKDRVDAEIARFAAASERLKYMGSKWCRVVRHIPFLGTAVRSVLNLFNLRTRFYVKRLLARAGISNWKLLSDVFFALAGIALWLVFAALLNLFNGPSQGNMLFAAVFFVLTTPIIVPMIADGLASVIGTLSHARGDVSFIRNSNLAHLARNNVFTPRRYRK